MLDSGASTNWGSELKHYEMAKKTLAWNTYEKPAKITHKEMKEKDGMFNPILQEYTNTEYNKRINIKDRKLLINTLAKNKDSSLRIEQTFDVITLQDKLKGLENKNEYPPQFKGGLVIKTESSKSEYNILSCITLDKHNAAKPEDRPVILNKTSEKVKTLMMPSKTIIDFDIITNKYKEFNEEKKLIDIEVNRLNAAKLYHKKNVYNPIQAKFYDSSKEKERRTNNEIRSRTFYKTTGEGDLYNPISMCVKDANQLKVTDQKMADKKKRYEVRYEIENHYRYQDLEKTEVKNRIISKKISYCGYKEQGNRGFDILKHERNNNYITQVEFKDKNSDWDTLVEFAGDKNTFKTKKAFKHPYDFSDVNKVEKIFLNNREDSLKKLPNIKDDSNFKITKQIESKSKLDCKNNIVDVSLGKTISKNTFFRTYTNNFYDSKAVTKKDINGRNL